MLTPNLPLHDTGHTSQMTTMHTGHMTQDTHNKWNMTQGTTWRMTHIFSSGSPQRGDPWFVYLTRVFVKCKSSKLAYVTLYLDVNKFKEWNENANHHNFTFDSSNEALDALSTTQRNKWLLLMYCLVLKSGKTTQRYLTEIISYCSPLDRDGKTYKRVSNACVKFF